jgi:pimeloyl-ACP methyl ester carboxylesterase
MTVQIANVSLDNAEEKYVEMSHGTTRYIDAGDGYPTILVHGVGYAEGAHNWFLNIGPLSQRLRVIAVDALAWGKGQGWLEQEYSFAYLVDFVREFQDALGLDKTNLVGHSMGGWIASLFGYESPHRLNKLVLVATSEGKVVGDVQPLLRLNVACIAEDGGNRQNGSAGGGGRIAFPIDHFRDHIGHDAANRAVAGQTG